jgi:calcium-dependent protein kinase
MQYMEGGELFARLLEKKAFSEREAANVLRQVLLAVSYIHHQGVTHFKVKPDSFFYESPNSNHVSIVGFGCSTMCDINAKVEEGSHAVDMWSVGTIAFALLSGRIPFQKKPRMDPTIWGSLSSDANNFTESLLCSDPAARLTATSALAHPWIQRHCQNKVSQMDPYMLQCLCTWDSHSKLQRACMLNIAWNLSKEERAKYRDYFLTIDTDHDGVISLADLKNVLRDPDSLNEVDWMGIEFMLKSLSNGTDHIDYNSFVAALVSEDIRGLEEDQFQNVFRKFDSDNSGCFLGEDLTSSIEDTTDIADLLEGEVEGRFDYSSFLLHVRGSDSFGTSSKATNSSAHVALVDTRSEVASLPTLLTGTKHCKGTAKLQASAHGKNVQGSHPQQACCTRM